ncbi:hypothetical protein [Bradyrhizobium elkanii]|uniref:Uncharacterized protein n=1 Tax=Bradyrhizobium elkanii TaxID=29448 RepID=A0ABV4F067_BRAEL|nr:hypothetical protein [Bradyrhizobium elkanii]MCP1757828.1 hypothetical protein [Bradyrhizobium elkanii]MCS3881875.1 hypothetical protein [Bradyrhizobium elkanii]MCS4218634.1 hypothetical protein [Bradyrhizobium elkanii]MCW2110066.1 hypothetical protein [Bradyrhizobium elkanii]MCW2201562.1 hypothetical protein [Bradyrhizobium elkanii]
MRKIVIAIALVLGLAGGTIGVLTLSSQTVVAGGGGHDPGGGGK